MLLLAVSLDTQHRANCTHWEIYYDNEADEELGEEEAGKMGRIAGKQEGNFRQYFPQDYHGQINFKAGRKERALKGDCQPDSNSMNYLLWRE